MPIIISKEAQEFHSKLDIEYEAFKDVECGLHSGFPKCCILFFVMVWRDWIDGNKPGGIHAYWNTEKAFGVESPGYIPCPACILSKNIVKVNRCNCHRQRILKFAK